MTIWSMPAQLAWIETQAENDQKSKLRSFHLPDEYNILLTEDRIFNHQVSFTSGQI